MDLLEFCQFSVSYLTPNRFHTVRTNLTVLIQNRSLKSSPCFLLCCLNAPNHYCFGLRNSKHTEVNFSFIKAYIKQELQRRTKIKKTFTSERCNANFRPACFASKSGSKKSLPCPALKTETPFYSMFYKTLPIVIIKKSSNIKILNANTVTLNSFSHYFSFEWSK